MASLLRLHQAQFVVKGLVVSVVVVVVGVDVDVDADVDVGVGVDVVIVIVVAAATVFAEQMSVQDQVGINVVQDLQFTTSVLCRLSLKTVVSYDLTAWASS